MEPLPETDAAITELEAWGEVGNLASALRSLATWAEFVVPDLVGVSITRLEQGLTFTLVASSAQVGVFDGLQYLAGGPCVTGAEDQQSRVTRSDDPLDEERWRLFSAGTAARGVRSTLTLPLRVADDGLGSVNLYAASGHAFDGHHDELAGIFGAWATGAVTNADLSFSTRAQAQRAPTVIREITLINTAIGILASRFDIDVDDAQDQLQTSATLAGVSVLALAGLLIDTIEDESDHGDE